MVISDFIKPKNIEEAVTVLHQLGSKAVLMAGGTAFQFLTTDAEKIALDITALGLKKIKQNNGSYSIGALTTISEMQDFSDQGWMLNSVAKKFATQQIRNMSTLGGNIAQVFPWSDLPVALLALGAEITTFDGVTDTVHKAENYFKKQPARLLNNKSLITYISVPAVTDNSGFGYHKEVRTSGAFSTLTAAVYITCENNVIKDVKLAVGAALGLPKRLTAIEDELKGKAADKTIVDEVIKSLVSSYSWKGKEGTTDSYAAHLAGVIITDVLTAALQNAKGEVK
jgi:aerobic carbon-monoxide dehydrogenase medium subunit